MGKTALRALLGMMAIGIGVGMGNFWQDIRPSDPFWPMIVGVAIVTAFSAFTCMYFMTRAGGSGD